MSLPPLPDLTVPSPGSTTARAVLSAALGRLLEDLERLPASAPPAAAGTVRQLLGLATEVRRKDPGALVSALRRPTVGTLLRCARSPGRTERESLLQALLAQLAFELAAVGALPHSVELRAWPQRLLSLGARLAVVVPSGLTALRLENGALVLERGATAERVLLDGGDARLERPYVPLSDTLVLALADNNPLALEEAHPDKQGNALDLGGQGVDEWVRALRAALALLREHLPDLHAELTLYLSQLLPVGYHPERHLSASYQEAIGSAYLSLHPDPMTLAEALVHEFSHNKLNALLELDPVLENPRDELHRSPVRPDPRPLHGVLLAVHAFVPVARLYERMLEAGAPLAARPGFQQRFDEVRAKNREGTLLLLRHARPTPAGRQLLAELERWHGHDA